MISTIVVSENLPMVDESTNVAATVSTSSFGCLVEKVTCRVQIKLVLSNIIIRYRSPSQSKHSLRVRKVFKG